MTKRVLMGVAVVISGLVLAGCGGQTGGTGTPTSSTASDGGAPEIPQPELDAKKFLNEPCSLITTAQKSAFGSKDSGKVNTDQTGSYCFLSPSDGLKGASYSIGVTSQNNLAALYRNRGNIPVFRPGTVAGYPSVTGNSNEGTVEGDCSAYVGVARDVAAYVEVTPRDRNSADYKDPCPLAEKVAATVVNNIKGGK